MNFSIWWILSIFCALREGEAWSSSSSENSFSLSAYRKARAEATSQALDASRFHFQILFVDRDNVSARIAEGLFARVAEYNDALFTLFPFSATLSDSGTPRDAKPSDVAVAACESLGLCSVRSTAMGSSFDASCLDEYDLVLAMNDDVRSNILRSIASPDDQDYYAPRIRLLSDFLSSDFALLNDKDHADEKKNGEGRVRLENLLEEELFQRIEPFASMVTGRSSDIFATPLTWEEFYKPRMVLNEATGAAVANPEGWATTEAALIAASAGLTRFCLDTMDLQFETAFQGLLGQHFRRAEHLSIAWEEADSQLRRSSNSITGYFSPGQRRERFEQHIEALKQELS